jgi:transketolase
MSSELTPELRELIENTIRGLTMDAVERAGIGHLGAPMGLARPVFLLWDDQLRFDPGDPAWPLRDRFVLSGGHASMLLYSLLHLFGFQVSLHDIESFRQLGSLTPGHPEYGETPGVEVTTGPLGQGFANAVGMALAARMTRARFGRGGQGPGHHRIWATAGDGDLMEGVCYEAASLAGHLGLGNLIVLYDENRVTIDGPTSIAFSEDVRARFEAQRWHVQSVDGEDVERLARALRGARDEAERPSIVITRTTIGHGSPGWAGLSKAHGGPFGPEELQATKENLGIPLEPGFLVPSEVRDYMAGRIEAKRAERAEADRRLATWRTAHPELAEHWDATRSHEMPPDLGARLAEGLEGKADATRKHSGAVIQRIQEIAPILVGGSADLAGSNNSTIKASGFVGPAAEKGEDAFAGSNIHFGVREHSMAAITNGIALDGTFRPFCATFMVFSDYMRPSLRLAALMKLPVVFVFTHDSVFVGEDGPTHQPVEQLDALRSIPGLTVFRPADGVETAMAWAWALQRARGPVALALTRQGVPALKREAPFALRDVWRGAYRVREPEERPEVVLLASGSEVVLASDAATLLASENVAVRVVSMPSLELLGEQPEAYLRELLPEDIPVVAVEAARGESLRGLVGRRGMIHGIGRFGASAPAQKLAEFFGYTPERLAARVLGLLRREAP